jgi:hypothetical protein
MEIGNLWVEVERLACLSCIGLWMNRAVGELGESASAS